MAKNKENHAGYEDRLIIALASGHTALAQEIVDTRSIELTAVMQTSGRHMISAVVLQRLASLSLPAELKNKAAAVARNAVFAALAASATIRSELRRLARLFGAAGIEFMLIKGFAVDKNPLRAMNDIDILIPPTDLERAFVTLEAHGYRYEGSAVLSAKEMQHPESQLAWNNQFQFRPPKTGISVEVHINLFERDRIRLENLDRLLDRVELFWERRIHDEELGCFVPSREASLALLCVHSATKRSPAHNTFILRHAYDIVHILDSGIDSERFFFLCRAWEIQYYAVVSLRLAAIALEDDSPRRYAEILERDLNATTRHLLNIHISCYRGLGRASTLHRARYTVMMPFAIGGSITKGLRWYLTFLFPPLWHQEQRFGIKRTSPLILVTYVIGPFARLYTAFGGGRRHQPTKSTKAPKVG